MLSTMINDYMPLGRKNSHTHVHTHACVIFKSNALGKARCLLCTGLAAVQTQPRLSQR